MRLIGCGCIADFWENVESCVPWRWFSPAKDTDWMENDAATKALHLKDDFTTFQPICDAQVTGLVRAGVDLVRPRRGPDMSTHRAYI